MFVRSTYRSRDFKQGKTIAKIHRTYTSYLYDIAHCPRFPAFKPSRTIPYTLVDVYMRYYTYIFYRCTYLSPPCRACVDYYYCCCCTRVSFFTHSFYIPARRELKYIRLWIQQYIHCRNTAAAKKPKPPLAVYALDIYIIYIILYISIEYYNIYYYYTLRAWRPSRGVWNVRHAARNRIQTPDGAPSEYFGIWARFLFS